MTEIERSSSSPGFRRKPRGEACAARRNKLAYHREYFFRIMKPITLALFGVFVGVRLAASMPLETLDRPFTLIGCYHAHKEGVDYRKCVELTVRKQRYRLHFTAVALRAEVRQVTEISLEVDGVADELSGLLQAIKQTASIDKLRPTGERKMHAEIPHFTLILPPSESAATVSKHDFVSENVSKALDQLVDRRKSTALRLVEYEIDGDMVPAIQVSISELAQKPGKWDGKRVRVEGYIVAEFEHHAIYMTRFHRWRMKGGIWLDGSLQTAAKDARAGTTGLTEVEGVFRAGASGHMGHFIGRIERVTYTK